MDLGLEPRKPDSCAHLLNSYMTFHPKFSFWISSWDDTHVCPSQSPVSVLSCLVSRALTRKSWLWDPDQEVPLISSPLFWDSIHNIVPCLSPASFCVTYKPNKWRTNCRLYMKGGTILHQSACNLLLVCLFFGLSGGFSFLKMSQGQPETAQPQLNVQGWTLLLLNTANQGMTRFQLQN